MKNIIKSAITIGQILGTVAGNNVRTASGGTFKQYPYLSFVG